MNYISEQIWIKNQRAINEDSLCLCHANYCKKELLLAAVCDGVGSRPGSQKASGIIIANLKNTFFALSHHPPMSFNRMINSLSRCIYSSHTEISMGATTLCLVFIYGNKGIIMSCGDSRAYLGKKTLQQLTPDHKDHKGRLLQAIGDTSFSHLYKKRFSFKTSMSILICSDGFYRRNHKEIIASNSFFSCSNEEMLRNTLEKFNCTAVNKGENDNSSAILIKRLS